MPTYWGDILLSNDDYNPVPTYSPTNPSTGTPAAPPTSGWGSGATPINLPDWLNGLNLGPGTGGFSGIGRLLTRRELRTLVPDSTKYFDKIDTKYTQAGPTDSFAPMRMYQQFERTGRLPGGMSGASPASPAAPAAGGGGDTGSGYTTGGK